MSHSRTACELRKEVLRFTHAAKLMIVDFIDPQFAAVAVAREDLEGDSVNGLFSVVRSVMVGANLIG